MMMDLLSLQNPIAALVMTSWVAILSVAGLRGWNGWLALKRTELELLAGRHAIAQDAGDSAVSPAARIEVADLKERIRKLEAIAAGIDL